MEDEDGESRVGRKILEHLAQIANADRIQNTHRATAECGKQGKYSCIMMGGFVGFVPARASTREDVGEGTRVAMVTATERPQ